MERSVVFLLSLLSVFILTVSVEAFTNGERYVILTENLVDVEEADNSANDDVTAGDKDDTIYFPRDENDDVNTNFLIEQLGFKDFNIVPDDVIKDDGQLMEGCNCSMNRCNCCISKVIRAKVLWKRYKARLSTCITLEYLPTNRLGYYRLTFEVYGKTMCRSEISLRYPGRLCYSVPHHGTFAHICLEFYDVELDRKNFCARVTGFIDLRLPRWHFRVKIACFQIPTAEDDKLKVTEGDTVQLTSQGDQLPVMTIA